MTTHIGSLVIGAGQPCRLIAEISNNHNGALPRALKLLEAMKDAGADAVKFQAYTPEELVVLRGDGPAPEPWGSQGWTMRRLYEKARTPFEWFPTLAAKCRELELPWFSSVFGPESLALLERLHCPAYKIARLDNQSRRLIDLVQHTGKPWLVSTDGVEVRYTDGGHAPRFLYCPPGYPAPVSAVHLPDDFARAGFVGLSSHCLAAELPVAAVTRGCQLIEMHVMLAEEPSELESEVSLNEFQFADMVRAVRRTEEMLG